jgi:hypothetical protein
LQILLGSGSAAPRRDEVQELAIRSHHRDRPPPEETDRIIDDAVEDGLNFCL